MAAQKFKVAIRRSLWGGRYEVGIEPPVSTYSLQNFPTLAEAELHAKAIAGLEGWPVERETGE